MQPSLRTWRPSALRTLACALFLLAPACGQEPVAVQPDGGRSTDAAPAAEGPPALDDGGSDAAAPDGADGGPGPGTDTGPLDACPAVSPPACEAGAEPTPRLGEDGCLQGYDCLPPLPSDVHPVSSLELDSPDSELAPLDAVIGSATYVGLGENVHTSGGFYRTKHRLFKYLVERHGFRAFGWETPWPDAEPLAAYVDSCQGDVEQLVGAGVFGVFASAETVELFEWMCDWNRTHADDKLTFFGFDVQQPYDDEPALRTFLTERAGDDATALIEGFATCSGYFPQAGPLLVSAEGHQACLDGLLAVEAYLDANQERLLAETSARELTRARVRVVGLRSWENEVYYFEAGSGTGGVQGGQPDVIKSLEGRDEGMASVLRTFRELMVPGKRVAVWAHNTHLMQANTLAQGYFGGGRTMGTFMRSAVGEAYVAIGLTAFQVSIDWPGVGTGPVDYPFAAGSLEPLLHGLGRPYAIVTTAAPAAGSTPAPLLTPGGRVSFGLGGADRFVPSDQFGAIFYLDVSPAMDPILW